MMKKKKTGLYAAEQVKVKTWTGEGKPKPCSQSSLTFT